MPFRLAVLFAVSLVVSPASAAEQPNIVLILADDLGIADLGCYGRSEHRTPNLDLLASQGMKFTSAYCAQPICSPSRAALMTGLCPARLNLTNYLPGRPDAASQRLLQPRIEGQLPLEETTIAEVLQQQGYATGLFGKWHLGGPGFGPEAQGFDVVVSPPANPEDAAAAGGKGEYLIASAAEAFIEQHKDKPFFCYVPHNSPHIGLAADPARIAHYPDTFQPTYAAMIETLDDSIGRLMQKVDSLGLTNQTIFIFTSDNGGLHVLESPGTPATSNAPYRAGKGFLYEGGLREPLIIRWPGVVSAGSVCQTPIVLTDLVPTLLDAAGVDTATTVGPLDGVNIKTLLQGEPLPERPLCWHFPHYTNQGSRPASAIRSGNWKLIEQLEDGRIELYDLAADTGETRNVAQEHPAEVAALLGQLAAWRSRVGAKVLMQNPDFNAQRHQRLYIEQDPSLLKPAQTAAATEPAWQMWRAAMNKVTQGRQPAVTPATGDIRLLAKDATVHGDKLRYEPEPHKNVLGYWTSAADWAEWEFDVPVAGHYEIEIQFGCGQGSGGAVVNVDVGGQTLTYTVQETGHFQAMILQTIGEVNLTAGRQTLALRPQSKPGVAVQDVRRVVLRPVN